MTVTIRNNAFETNSSSMHSIVVMKDKNRRYTKEEYENSMFIDEGVYNIYDEEELQFDRAPFRVLVAPGDKLKYAIASLCGPLSDRKDKADAKLAEITAIIRKYIPKLEKINLPTDLVRLWVDEYDNLYEPWETAVDDDGVRRAVNPDTGDRVRVEIDRDFYDEICYGSVDHQSEFLLQNFLKDTGTSLEDFLTMPKYIVLVDGDEYHEGEKLAHYGILNLANAEIYDKGEHQNWMHG